MSKSSPIEILDSDEEELNDPPVERKNSFFIVSDDDDVPSAQQQPVLQTVKRELDDSGSSSTPTTSPMKAIKLNSNRLKWLKGQVNLKKSETSARIIPPKQEIFSDSSHIEEKKRVEACLKYDNSPSKKPTTRKKLALDSPRKPGAFGSPQKTLTQTKLNAENFSPKKLMFGSEKRLEDHSDHHPPLHASQHSTYARYKSTKEVIEFTRGQLNYLEAIEEEGEYCLSRYIDTLIGFVSPYCKPPSDLCFHLLKGILLNSKDNHISIKVFNTLKRIHCMHPNVPEQMNRRITMEFLEDIVNMVMDGCKCLCLDLKSQNALKAFDFIVDVIEQEVKRKMTANKTIAFRLLSADRNSSNIRKVLHWICNAVKLCSQQTVLPQFFDVLDLCQRLFGLCVNLSDNPDKCAENLAGEMLGTYSQLPTLECRKIFLQTLHSNLVKSMFLQTYIQLFCGKADSLEEETKYTKGIQHIIESNFQRLPRKRDDVQNIEARKHVDIHRSEEECEEHAMIISSNLQSHLFCYHKKLQGAPKKMLVNLDGISKMPDQRHLSMQDSDAILNMWDKAEEFAGRLTSLNPSLNSRTKHLIDLFADMKMWDPW